MEEGLSQVWARLSGVTIENLPWEEYVERYDDEGSFFYLDPPYSGFEKDYGKGIFSPNDFARMADTLASIKGDFILSINDTPEIRHLFERFNIEEVQTTYTAKRGKNRKTQELLIMNYEPPRRA